VRRAHRSLLGAACSPQSKASRVSRR